MYVDIYLIAYLKILTSFQCNEAKALHDIMRQLTGHPVLTTLCFNSVTFSLNNPANQNCTVTKLQLIPFQSS